MRAGAPTGGRQNHFAKLAHIGCATIFFDLPVHMLKDYTPDRAAIGEQLRRFRPLPPVAGDFPDHNSSHHVELDALGQRERAAIVDGVDRTPHIGFPRVGSGLASAAGLFLATEGATNFRAGWADIDVGNAAIGATHRQKFFRFAQVVGEDGRRQPLRNGVVQLEHGIEIAILHHVEDRRKGLVLHRSGLRRDLDQRRADIVGVSRPFDGDALTAMDLSSGSVRSLECTLHAR